MTHISAHVFFPDGTILYAEYTGDQVLPTLYSTVTELMRNWRSGDWTACSHEGEECVVNPPGFSWKAKGCKECRCITDLWMPGDEDTPVTEGDYVV